MTALLLGADGGNTKTVALVAAPDGTIVGTGRSGCSDLYNAASVEAALEAVAEACAEAVEAAAATAGDVAAACFSLAGADWPEDFELLLDQLPARIGLPVEPLVVNDAVGAIRAGTPDGVGVAVVCGTFGVASARNGAGDVFHLGWWPDSTGARPLGDEALAAVWRADLGLGPETALTGRALALYGADSPMGLLHLFTRRGGLARTDADRLAAAVLDEADAGDVVARSIVARQGRLLGDQARACADRVGLLGRSFPVVLAGGVLRHPSRLLADAIMARVPGGEAVRGADEPVVGALLFAFDRAGITPSRERMRASAPPPATFATHG